MRGTDLVLARPLLKPEHLVGLFTRHADSPAARSPRLLFGGLLRPSFAPALRAPVEIGLDQGSTLSIRRAQLLEQNAEFRFAQRGEHPACELAFQAASFHGAAVMVEHHLEGVGAHL